MIPHAQRVLGIETIPSPRYRSSLTILMFVCCHSIVMHGDAAFAGQGIVYETMGLSKLPAYTVGGTIHFVVNNQIGFTTDAAMARSSPYCTDLAKAYNAPIFHVNGDDPEAVVQVSELAVEWRQKYGTDVVIDFVCYRFNGHNEIDEPFFTQPVMYHKVKAAPPTLEVYAKRLVDEGVATEAELKAITDRIQATLAAKEAGMLDFKPQAQSLSARWAGLKPKGVTSVPQRTGVPLAKLRELGLKVNTPPADLNVHPRLAKILGDRRAAYEKGSGLDWSQGESLAWATLLTEGKHVRLSGQDVERGTFSHRHAVYHDQKSTEKKT
jgi:2-oxoglutarate dehydrogenase E1 component